jgi:hypothetical protein
MQFNYFEKFIKFLFINHLADLGAVATYQQTARSERMNSSNKHPIVIIVTKPHLHFIRGKVGKSYCTNL